MKECKPRSTRLTNGRASTGQKLKMRLERRETDSSADKRNGSSTDWTLSKSSHDGNYSVGVVDTMLFQQITGCLEGIEEDEVVSDLIK